MSVENLSPLLPEEIEENIKLNAEQGIDLKELRDRLAVQLKNRRWDSIKAAEVELKNKINIQSLIERIDYIDQKLNGVR